MEAAHKQIKYKYVFDEFYTTLSDEFFLKDVLLTIVNYHNNIEHSSTHFRPIDIKDRTDPKIIEIVNNNISKTINYAIKYKNLYLLEKDEYLLIINNIKLNNNKDNNIKEIVKNKKNISGEYIIPAQFVKYSDNYKLNNIKVSKNFKKILKNDSLYLIESDLCRIVSKKGYNYFMS